MRRTPDPVTLFAKLDAEPYAFDYYQALRTIECAYADKPRLGQALKPSDEPIRLGQEPALDFAPATISALDRGVNPPRLAVRFFGLFGANGALPLHLTEYARDRLRNHGDPTFARFADIFHHRFLALFYRAWAQAQPTVSYDRPDSDRFSSYIGALFGLAMTGLRRRDAVADHGKLFGAGHLARQVRNAAGLQALLRAYFKLPIGVQEYVGHWLQLPVDERTRIGARPLTRQLGVDAVIGTQVWDRQHKIRLSIGPLDWAQYRSFLPGGERIRRLRDWLRNYLCFEFLWDANIVLRESDVPRCQLGKHSQLGWTSWLGKRRDASDAADLVLDCEAVLARLESRAGAQRARGANA